MDAYCNLSIAPDPCLPYECQINSYLLQKSMSVNVQEDPWGSALKEPLIKPFICKIQFVDPFKKYSISLATSLGTILSNVSHHISWTSYSSPSTFTDLHHPTEYSISSFVFSIFCNFLLSIFSSDFQFLFEASHIITPKYEIAI